MRTKSPQKAKVHANIAAAKLEAYWSQLRLAKSDVIGMSLVRTSATDSLHIHSPQHEIDCPTLLDALEIYLETKGKGRPETFRVAATRSCKYLIGLCGNKANSYLNLVDSWSIFFATTIHDENNIFDCSETSA